MFRSAISLLLSSCLLFSAGASAQVELPGLGESSARTLTPLDEQRIGMTAYRQIRSLDLMIDDYEVTAYIQAVGRRVAAGSGHPAGDFTFFGMRDTNINAFAMPGGFIGVNAGLLMSTRNESELAAVLAHEVTHVTQHHIARVLEATRPYSIATAALVVAAILLGGGDPDITQAAISAGLASSLERQVNFTRAHEHEADRIGMHLLASSGYDPAGMAGFFGRLEEQARYYRSEYAEFLRTHPLTTTRIAEAQTRARAYTGTPRPDSKSYLLMRERIRVLSADQPIELVNDYRKNLAQNPDDQALRYGLALSLLRSSADNEAISQFAELLDADEGTLYYHLGFAAAQLALGNKEQALEAYERALRFFPDNQNIRFRQAEAQLLLGNPQAAQAALQRVTRESPLWPEPYRLLARAAGELGQTADSHLHFADYYWFNGQVPSADKQLQTALRQADLTDFDRERLKAKQQEFKARKKLLDD